MWNTIIYNDYVLAGNYDIINLRYFDEDIKQNSLLYIKEDDTKKEEKFIKGVNPKAIEGSEIGIYYDNYICNVSSPANFLYIFIFRFWYQ